MPHESSSVQKLDNEEAFVERARGVLQQLQTIDPTKVHCMMGMVVTESPSNKDEAAVLAFVLGSDEDIAKMISSLVTITRNGIVQANTPPNHNDEVKH
ncbi:MAG: hypothetical protein KatS3mg015_2646 [Fimbriimonadales bacterium]|nr:MAG: hypothetical protein KatS3mg015_2646 [Fimbriimonadales bacterium]